MLEGSLPINVRLAVELTPTVVGMEHQAAVLLLTFVAPWPGRAHISLSRHLVMGG